LAIAVARQEHFEDALQLIERCNADQLDPTLASALLYEQAWSLHRLKRDEEAAKAYRQLLARESVGSLRLHALLELAGIEIEARRHKAAAELLRRLHTLLEQPSADAPRDLREQAIYSLAVCEFELQRFSEAADLFTRLLDEFPDSELIASASYFCGEALFRLERHERAVAHLSRVVDDFPADPAYSAALLRLGESLSVLQRWARAERTFSRFLERFPDSDQCFQAQFGLGWTRENQQRYDEAIDAYRKVVDEHEGPTAARAQFQIGECLFAKNEYEDAAGELLKVDILYAYPEWSAAALYEAGRCFEKLAKHIEARQQFKQVTEKYADTNWGRLAAQRLDANMSGSIPGR
jgi:TolA-binding protein